MAYDIDTINEVRVYFETHDDEITEVAKKYELPPTTVSTWKKQGKANEGIEWVRGKYKEHKDAAKKIVKGQIASEIAAAVTAELSQEILGNMPNPTDKDKQNAVDVAEALIKDMLILNNLNREMAWAVVKAKGFAETAKNIGTIEVYTKIIERAKNQIFGKDPDIVNIFAASSTNITPSDLKNKTTEELMLFIKQKTDEAKQLKAKQEAIDAEVTNETPKN